MTTWKEYKDKIKETDPLAKKDLEEIEELAEIISAIISQRKALGLTQRDLATLCEIPQSSVARIESHRTTPKLDTLIKILQPLGLKISITKNQ